MSKQDQSDTGASYTSDSAQSTQEAAASIVGGMRPADHASVIALRGDLGAGKTQFAKGAARSLGIERTVTSPTFLIMRSYEASKGSWKRLFHLDCYRIEDPQELRALGWDEIVANPENLVLVEWAERVSAILPEGTVWVQMDITSPTERAITVHP